MTGAAPSNSNSSRAFDRSQLRNFSTLPSSAASLGRREQRVERQRGWGLKTDMERGESEGADRRDRGTRQAWTVRWREHRKSDGVVDGERWRWTCRTICPLPLSPSPRPCPCPAYSSPAWKPSPWPSWGEERQVPHGRPPATVNSCTPGTSRGFGPRIPQSIALGSCLLPDVKIWGLWVVLFISKMISL